MDFRDELVGIVKDFDYKDEILNILKNPLINEPSLIDAFNISFKYGVSLHPKYLFYWNELSVIDFILFVKFVSGIKFKLDDEGEVKYSYFNNSDECKRFLEIIGVEHVLKKVKSKSKLKNGEFVYVVVIDKDNTLSLLVNLGVDVFSYSKGGLNKFVKGDNNNFVSLLSKIIKYSNSCLDLMEEKSVKVVDILNEFGAVDIRDKGGTYIGCRMGRPEKAKMRKNCHKQQKVHGVFTSLSGVDKEESDVKGLNNAPNNKGIEENNAKGALRERRGVYVNKDGTVRFDMTQMGITHFKPCEIGTSILRLKELGYVVDYLGKPLNDVNQLIEILPQDVILPDNVLSGDEKASDFVIDVSKFIDDELSELYGMDKFYNIETRDDTIGHLIVGLAPHTSAGIVGRIIGYSETQGCFANPIWHAAQRRNLDGDETGVMLLLDCLINFSKDYLPQRTGSNMDIPLVLTSILHLDQVDDEVFNVDIEKFYPLELYEKASLYSSAKDVKIKSVGDKLNCEDENEKYSGYNFTHGVENFNDTVLCSAYKTIPKMVAKLNVQLEIAKKIRAVDENIVASLVIEKHFMKDIKGNLRRFSSQSFRCTSCNQKYRRPPLNNVCSKCRNSSINFTVHEGSIRKYLDPSFDIIEKYNVDPYLKETLELAKLRVEGLFGKKK